MKMIHGMAHTGSVKRGIEVARVEKGLFCIKVGVIIFYFYKSKGTNTTFIKKIVFPFDVGGRS